MLKNRVLPTVIIALVGAITGSFLMMLYASTHFANVAGPDHTPPAVSAAPLVGVSDQDRIVSAVKRVKPSVVAIDVQVNGKQYVPLDPLAQFFGQQGPVQVRPFTGRDSGSGFVYNSDGYIVTNAHVVRPPVANSQVSSITVVFQNGDKVPAHVVAENIGADLAIIKVDNYKKLPPPLVLADSDKLNQGQWAIAIGEPYELQETVTVGVVSAFNRSEPIQTDQGQEIDFKGLLQTSAPINPGNSGGPLVDINGDVIGVNQSTLRGGAQGIGFAIPSNTVKHVVGEMIAHPGITQGTGQAYIGVWLADVNAGFRNQTGYRGKGGVAILQVESGSPADQAGLQPGDVILALDGKPFDNYKSLAAAISKMKPGEKATFEIWSQGAKRLVTVTLGEKPAAMPIQPGGP